MGPIVTVAKCVGSNGGGATANREKEDDFPDDEMFNDIISDKEKEKEERLNRILAWYIEESNNNKEIASVAGKKHALCVCGEPEDRFQRNPFSIDYDYLLSDGLFREQRFKNEGCV